MLGDKKITRPTESSHHFTKAPDLTPQVDSPRMTASPGDTHPKHQNFLVPSTTNSQQTIHSLRFSTADGNVIADLKPSSSNHHHINAGFSFLEENRPSTSQYSNILRIHIDPAIHTSTQTASPDSSEKKQENFLKNIQRELAFFRPYIRNYASHSTLDDWLKARPKQFESETEAKINAKAAYSYCEQVYDLHCNYPYLNTLSEVQTYVAEFSEKELKIFWTNLFYPSPFLYFYQESDKPDLPVENIIKNLPIHNLIKNLIAAGNNVTQIAHALRLPPQSTLFTLLENAVVRGPAGKEARQKQRPAEEIAQKWGITQEPFLSTLKRLSSLEAETIKIFEAAEKGERICDLVKHLPSYHASSANSLKENDKEIYALLLNASIEGPGIAAIIKDKAKAVDVIEKYGYVINENAMSENEKAHALALVWRSAQNAIEERRRGGKIDATMEKFGFTQDKLYRFDNSLQLYEIIKSTLVFEQMISLHCHLHNISFPKSFTEKLGRWLLTPKVYHNVCFYNIIEKFNCDFTILDEYCQAYKVGPYVEKNIFSDSKYFSELENFILSLFNISYEELVERHKVYNPSPNKVISLFRETAQQCTTALQYVTGCVCLPIIKISVLCHPRRRKFSQQAA